MNLSNLNKRKVLMIAVLCCAVFVFTVTSVYAALTLNATTITSDGILNLSPATSVIINNGKQLKFTIGTLLGTTQAGALEYDGTHLYFTAQNAGARYQLDQQTAGSVGETDFTLTQNSVVSFASINAGAIANTLYLKAGNVGIGTNIPNSSLQIAGSLATALAAKTAGYTVTATDNILTSGTSSLGGPITFTLPTAVGITGRQYTFKKTEASANAVTIATTSGQTIDGASTQSLASQYSFINLVSDGANWVIVGKSVVVSTPVPDFSFIDQFGVAVSSTVTSNTVTLGTFTGTVTATCNGNCTAISRNGGSFIPSSAGGFVSGDTIAIQMTSSGSANTTTQTSVTVGTTSSGTWSVRTIDVQTFNTTGTWTKPSGYATNSTVLAQCWGGGGGGSGGNGNTNAGDGAGGGGGGYRQNSVALSTLGATASVTVGLGGTAGSGGNGGQGGHSGGNGGNSSFGSMTANGGSLATGNDTTGLGGAGGSGSGGTGGFTGGSGANAGTNNSGGGGGGAGSSGNGGNGSGSGNGTGGTGGTGGGGNGGDGTTNGSVPGGTGVAPGGGGGGGGGGSSPGTGGAGAIGKCVITTSFP